MFKMQNSLIADHLFSELTFVACCCTNSKKENVNARTVCTITISHYIKKALIRFLTRPFFAI